MSRSGVVAAAPKVNVVLVDTVLDVDCAYQLFSHPSADHSKKPADVEPLVSYVGFSSYGVCLCSTDEDDDSDSPAAVETQQCGPASSSARPSAGIPTPFPSLDVVMSRIPSQKDKGLIPLASLKA